MHQGHFLSGCPKQQNKNCNPILREIGSIPLLWCEQKQLGSILWEIKINCWAQSAWWTNQTKLATLFYIHQKWNAIFNVVEIKYMSETLPKAQRTWRLSSYHRISIKHQLQNLNQTSASRLNVSLKSWPNLALESWPRLNSVTSTKHQQQNADQTSSSTSATVASSTSFE